ncbi:type I restriction-modification enzyme, R subunit, partial [Trichinella spiralis]|uniref:type I restriction-modification enzyme, R subunit n=1 Tax=Trichinella spiralis TaxID=6334 RepID=UPI0001EFE10F
MNVNDEKMAHLALLGFLTYENFLEIRRSQADVTQAVTTSGKIGGRWTFTIILQ